LHRLIADRDVIAAAGTGLAGRVQQPYGKGQAQSRRESNGTFATPACHPGNPGLERKESHPESESIFLGDKEDYKPAAAQFQPKKRNAAPHVTAFATIRRLTPAPCLV
jgi:hypothetical protein